MRKNPLQLLAKCVIIITREEKIAMRNFTVVIIETV
jgi:hypothetical protein